MNSCDQSQAQGEAKNNFKGNLLIKNSPIHAPIYSKHVLYLIEVL